MAVLRKARKERLGDHSGVRSRNTRPQTRLDASSQLFLQLSIVPLPTRTFARLQTTPNRTHTKAEYSRLAIDSNYPSRRGDEQ